jgi:hypothetical protein
LSLPVSRVREEFARAGLHYDAALAALEIAVPSCGAREFLAGSDAGCPNRTLRIGDVFASDSKPCSCSLGWAGVGGRILYGGEQNERRVKMFGNKMRALILRLDAAEKRIQDLERRPVASGGGGGAVADAWGRAFRGRIDAIEAKLAQL